MNRTNPTPWVLPTEADPVARGALPLLGGPMGRYAGVGRSWWTPIRVSIVAGLLVYAVGWLSKGYCLASGFGAPQRYMYLCYSDIPILYSARGLADGAFPYLLEPGAGQAVLEYPVLTGVFMYVAAWVTRLLSGDSLTFFAVNVVGMSALLAWTIVSTGRTVARRPWDALMVALAPVVALAGFVNWDLLAVALTSAALAAWSRRHPAVAGMWLGLAVAAKFYPLVLIGPIALLCVRRGRWRALGVFLAAALGSWLVVNVPVMLANFEGWSRFYTFSRERGMDFGSPWYSLSLLGVELPAEILNTLASGSFLVACAGIAWLALRAPEPPRLAALAFLTVGAFVLTNKVYSPQYVLWVLPLAVMARPRWRDLLIWQAAESVYFVGIWWFLVGFGTQDKGLHEGWYVAATAAHWLATAWLMALVVRDVWWPRHDPVRNDGFVEDTDDPGGGVLDSVPARLAAEEAAAAVPVGAVSR
ncbi:MAG: glycosyltransferase 87 family protein [Actinomycetota bacterium]|nr:glycosyltransferase 87 family protein [Actinomycetota bacterium]